MMYGEHSSKLQQSLRLYDKSEKNVESISMEKLISLQANVILIEMKMTWTIPIFNKTLSSSHSVIFSFYIFLHLKRN